MKLHPVELQTLTPEVLKVFGAQPPLLTAGDKGGCNTMTIGWCQLGRLWNLPVCTVYVRPERYTYSYMENSDYFTVSVMPADRQKDVAFCGSHSGRDVDKIAACGLTVRYGAGDAPFFDEAERLAPDLHGAGSGGLYPVITQRKRSLWRKQKRSETRYYWWD